MTGIYLFALAAGLPLIIWSLLSGGDHGDGGYDSNYELGSGDFSGGDLAGDLGGGFGGGDVGGDIGLGDINIDTGDLGTGHGGLSHVGDHGAYGTHEGFGAIMLRLFPLSSISIFLSVFGMTGVALGLVGNSTVTTLGFALALGLGAGALNSTVFSYLHKSESNTAVSDSSLMGATGHVVLPIGISRRGRVALSMHGQTVYLSAQLLESENGTNRLDIHAPVLVVEVKHGIATVVPIEENLT
ncbi:MAG: hypothetical protein WC184_05515 [Acidimicrobiia bacterium]